MYVRYVILILYRIFYSTFLLNLIAKEQNKNSNNESIKLIELTYDENAVDRNNSKMHT